MVDEFPDRPDLNPDETRTALSATGQRGPDIGPYRLRQRLGEGGMGEVWLAEQTRPVQRQVALKIIKAGMDTAQVVARFEAERQALALMDHAAIATVFDGGSTPEGRPYFAMEYVKGEPITLYCDRQQLPVKERLDLFLLVCEGVQHAHQKGIIHRDLKPSNVLVTLQNDRPVPKIIDFGVAKATTQQLTARSLFTELGVLVGTPEYMSPEQAELTGLDIDTRTDVYALGVLLYELLTGALPFDRRLLREKGVDEFRRTIREVEPARPSLCVAQQGAAASETARTRRTEPARLASQIRGDLDWITMKALEKSRARRYDTVMGLATDVQRHLRNEPVVAGPPSAAYRTKKFVRRHRFGVTAATALTVLLIAFGALMAVQTQRLSRERDRANREAARANAEAVAATQVVNFLVGLFRIADPSEARGNSVTAREILDKGAREVEDALLTQPEVQARLQATIGGVYTGLGLYEAARPLLEHAVATERRVLGANHLQTLDAASQLAALYWNQSRFREAEALYAEILQGRTRALGPDHADTLKASFDLASVYMRQGRWADAERLQRQTLDIQRRVLGDDHADTLSSLGNLAATVQGQQRFAEASSLVLEVYEAKRRTLGEHHPSTLVAMHNVAFNCRGLGKYDEAESWLLRLIDAERRVLGDEHRLTARSRALLSTIFVKQRRFDDAETLALAAHATLLKVLGPADRFTLEVTRDLAALYDAWGKPDRAAAWRAQLSAAQDP